MTSRSARLLSLLAGAALLLGCPSTPTRDDPPPRRQDRPADPAPAPSEPAQPEPDRYGSPPERPAQAFERESIRPDDYAQPTFAELMDGPVATWRRELEPAFVPGNPQDMQAVEVSESWWNGKARLRAETRTEDGGWKAHGYGEAHYNSNGALFAKGYFRDGRLHGPWIFYREDGSIERIRCYAMGVMQGPSARFEDDAVVVYGTCTDDLGVGEWLDWDEEGNLNGRTMWEAFDEKTPHRVWRRIYNDDGQLTQMWRYQNNAVHGEIIDWVDPNVDDETGEVMNPGSVGRLELEQNDADGKVHGWLTFYHPTEGYREYDTWYEHGVQTGPHRKYDRLGRVIAEGMNEDGKRVGVWLDHSTDGTRERHYVAGVLDGPYRQTAPDGTLVAEGRFADGEHAGVWMQKLEPESVIPGYGLGETGLWTGRGETTPTGSYQGPWEWRRADGSLAASGTYAEGRKTGAWTVSGPDGTARYELSFAANLLDGPYRSFYADGTADAVGTYTKGYRDGDWVYYHPNGALRERGTHEYTGLLSELIGEWEFFDQEGRLNRKEIYDLEGNYQASLTREALLEDAPQGVVLQPEQPNGTWVLKNPTGVLVRRMVVLNGQLHGLVQEYYPTGLVGLEGEMYGELREGTWTAYYNNGFKKEENTYVAGVAEGTYKQWRPDGTLAVEGTGVAGMRNGPWTTYRGDGTTVHKVETYGAENKLHGPFQSFHPNGQLAEEGSYAAGVKDGVWKSFYDNGQLQSEGSWDAGTQLDDWKRFNRDGSPRE